jgi:hypothetical protein
MMAVLQLSVLSILSLGWLNPSFAILKGAILTNGFNKIDDNDPFMDFNSSMSVKGMEMFSRFLENYNIASFTIILPLLVGFIMFILSKTALKNKAETLQKMYIKSCF